MDKIITEYSKNDPIPEIQRFNEHLGIIMMGVPGVGKTSFIKNFILSKNDKFKNINPDNINRLLTRRETGFHPHASDLALKLIDKVSTTGHNIIYDISGNTEHKVKKAFDYMKTNNYTVIFIHLLAPLATAIKQNMNRERQVPNEVIKSYYAKNQQIIKQYSELNHDGYYIVLHLNNKYKFLKYENGKFIKKSAETY